MSSVVARAGHPKGGSYTFEAKPEPGSDGDGRDTATIFVHGYSNSGGSNCDSTFGSMMTKLREFGQTGPFDTVGYYDDDKGCTDDIRNHGSHTKHFGGSGKGHSVNTDIRHLGYHLAWFIHDKYSKDGTYVQIVAHSMGGLITRYALARSETSDAFPAQLLVEDVVTLGTPHAGAYLTCRTGCNLQRRQMHPESDLMNWFRKNAWHPDGFPQTDWTNIGSYNDVVVGQHSATQMGADHRVLYWGGGNNRPSHHSDYTKDTADFRDADVWWKDGGSYYGWEDGPHVVRWTDFALYHSNW